MKHKTSLDIMVATLKEAGADIRVEGKKHAKIFWSLNGKEFITVTGRTPSDHRVLKNAMRTLKIQLREAGHAI